jgi:hypothetical protein
MFDGATWRAATAGLAAADIQALFDANCPLRPFDHTGAGAAARRR